MGPIAGAKKTSPNIGQTTHRIIKAAYEEDVAQALRNRPSINSIPEVLLATYAERTGESQDGPFSDNLL